MAFSIKQGDTRPTYIAALKTNFGAPGEAPIDLSLSGTTVKFLMGAGGSSEPIVSEPATIEDAENGIVSYEWQAGDTAAVGTHRVEFEITWPDGGVETVPNVGYLEVTIVDDVG